MEFLQIVGVCYILLMLYLSFLYYKRNNYSRKSFLMWVVVWVGGITLLVVPESTSQITERLTFARVLDFYLILGLMFFSIICFLNYATVMKNEARIEELVRKIALERKKK